MIKFNHKAAVTAMLINHIPPQSQTEPQFFHDKTIQVSNSAPLKVNGMGCTFLKPGFLIKKLKNLAKKPPKFLRFWRFFYVGKNLNKDYLYIIKDLIDKDMIKNISLRKIIYLHK